MSNWSRYHLALPCPVCNRLRLEWRVEGEGLLLHCSKCGADHDFIADEAIRLSEGREASRE